MAPPTNRSRGLRCWFLIVMLLSVPSKSAAQVDDATIKREIIGGQHRLAALKNEEASFDSNREMVDYLNDILGKLLAVCGRKAPYPITFHYSSVPRVNAESLPGGPIVVEERMFDLADTEAQFVAVLAHETAHELNNDFLMKQSDYEREHPTHPELKVFEVSQWSETRADCDGARLMYDAGWDPQGMIDLYGRRLFPGIVGSHPSSEKRIEAIRAVIAKLPPKLGLIKDSARFRELKRKY
jgi:predicted Zn-dependent protease